MAAAIAKALAVLAVVLALRSWMLSYHVTDAEIARLYPSRQTYDGHGVLLDVSRGGDYQWRLPVRLKEIPTEMVADVLAVEDRRFFQHHGVDWLSSLRAAWQLLRHRRIISGASTLTMQLVNQLEAVPPRRRTPLYKLRQCGRAINWERTHSKTEILEEYFNRLPYGGSVVGIQAASQYYFGRPVSQLNRSEQILLAGLPQGPNYYRPDRHPTRAIRRRDTVLKMLVSAGRITPDEAAAIQSLPLRYRDFRVPAWPHAEADMDFIDLAAAQAMTPPEEPLHTTLYPEVQQAVREKLSNRCRQLPGVADGAVVVIENATGKIRSLVGGANGGDPRAAQVNGALAWRSPGSVLKPFIYGEAINGGLLVGDTVLTDAPLEFSGYRPGNADGYFRGRVTATRALADSLNTPAIRLLQRLTVPRMLERLAPLSLFRNAATATQRDKIARRTGLTFAIGGLESQLLALTAVYSSLGKVRTARFVDTGGQGGDDTDATDGAGYWHPGTVQMLLRMLSSHQLPNFSGRAAWKTGTSNGNRDAWCIAVTPRWTVGVWLGNKSGVPAEALVGATAAAPLAGSILAYLQQGAPPDWSDYEHELTTIMLCADSGLAPSVHCQRLQPGTAVAEIPLARCETCRPIPGETSRQLQTQVHSPAPGTYRRRPGMPTVDFRLECLPKQCHCYLNGSYLGLKENGEEITLPPGRHLLLFWGGEGYNGRTIAIEVK